MHTLRFFLLIVILFHLVGGTYEYVKGSDCNSNGVEDLCDIDCGAAGGSCDINGCGMSDDCNLNLRPDECDQYQPFHSSLLAIDVSATDFVVSQPPFPDGFLGAEGDLVHVSPTGVPTIIGDGLNINNLEFAPPEFTGTATLLGAQSTTGDIRRLEPNGDSSLFARLQESQVFELVYVPFATGGPAAGKILAGSCPSENESGAPLGRLSVVDASGNVTTLRDLPFCPYDLMLVGDNFGSYSHHVFITSVFETRIVFMDLLTLELGTYTEVISDADSSNGGGFWRMEISPVGWGAFLSPSSVDERVLLVAHTFDLDLGTIHIFAANGRRLGRLNSESPYYWEHVRPRAPVFTGDGVMFVGVNSNHDSIDTLRFASFDGFIIGDCNGNDHPDDCDLEAGALDCNHNGIIESCEYLVDCNGNLVQDTCDIWLGDSPDSDDDGIPNECEVSIVASDPPDGSIDARQPFRPDGTGSAMGWRDILLSVDGETCCGEITLEDFEISQEGGVLSPPTPVFFDPVTSSTGRIFLSRPIEPGAWTTITLRGSMTSVRLGFLPGDVNADRVVGAADILALIDSLQGLGTPPPTFQTDVNRSHASEPSDILRLIDLLNGADAFPTYLGATLPD